MEELSDLALLGIGAGALVIVYLLRVMWDLRVGKPRAQPKRGGKPRAQPKWRGRKPSKSNISVDLCPKFPPALHGVLGVKSLALGRHLVHRLSMQKFHRCQVAQC